MGVENEIQEYIQEQAEIDSFGVAASLFGLYNPRFTETLKELSTGQLRRLCNALVKYPLSDKEFITEHDQKLKDAFYIGENLLQAKFIMMMQAFQDHGNVDKESDLTTTETQGE